MSDKAFEEYNRENAERIASVSYTHLDVYKRQPKKTVGRKKKAK